MVSATIRPSGGSQGDTGPSVCGRPIPQAGAQHQQLALDPRRVVLPGFRSDICKFMSAGAPRSTRPPLRNSLVTLDTMTVEDTFC